MDSWILKIEALYSSDTLANINRNTRILNTEATDLLYTAVIATISTAVTQFEWS
jgi:hypothetical protein